MASSIGTKPRPRRARSYRVEERPLAVEGTIRRALSLAGRDDLQSLVDSTRLGLFVLRQGLVCYANSALGSLFGHPDAKPLLGSRFEDLVHPDDRALFGGSCAEDEGKAGSSRQALRVLTGDGMAQWVLIGTSPTFFQGKPATAGFLVNVAPLIDTIDSLQESLRRYETILDDVDVNVAEIDLGGNITFINDAGCRMWNLPREELMGRSWRAHITEETAQQHRELYRNVYTSGVPIKNLSFDVTDRSGKRRTIEKSVSLRRDASGTIRGFTLVSRDVTEQREATDGIREHRSRLEAIFGSVKDAILSVDPALRVVEANRSTENVCGVTAHEIIGREFSACPAECSRACHEILQQTLQRKSAIKERRIECGHRWRPQQVVSVSTAPLLDPGGGFTGAVLVIRDITLLSDVERKLRERSQFQSIVGRNKAMQDVYGLLEDLANVNTTVLVTGESGTGKELVARALHYSGTRAFKPFVTVNCSALSEGLLESELFGHVRGAFTGAVRDKLGRFQSADGGTLVLDEIGDISPLIQLKLLRVLQEKEFERVGESQSRRVDVRVIACTNQDLREKVRRGEFRQDLYYRLKVVEVALPPLRKRLEDIPLLVDHFRKTFNERFGKSIEGISADVLRAFMNHPWPGNVRELEHVMEHAFVLCHGGAIALRHLPADLRVGEADGAVAGRPAPGKQLGCREVLDALNRTGWNKAKAARLLGIGRQTMYRKIASFGLTDEGPSFSPSVPVNPDRSGAEPDPDPD